MPFRSTTRARAVACACVAAISVVMPLHGQDSTAAQRYPRDTTRLLHHGYDYGSDATFSPLSMMAHKGYEILQMQRADRRILRMDYGTLWHNGVVQPLRYPASAIQRFGGWGRFTRVELLPLGFSLDEMNWFVNWTEHLFAGGLTMRKLDEYYRAHNIPAPRVMAALTTYAASAMNEMQEYPAARGAIAATVADLLFFDTAALLMFHFDAPARFFVKTLRASDWSPMAGFTLPEQELWNNGTYYALKPPIGLDRTRLFVRGGMGAQLGLSRLLGDGVHSVSVGLGGDAQVRRVDPVTGHETVGFAPAGGVFYDRNESLLWSVTTSPGENLVSVNVYPGVLPGKARVLGVWGVYSRSGHLSLGLLHRKSLGLGLGLGR